MAPPNPAASSAGASPKAATAARPRLPSIRRPREAATGVLGFYRDPLAWPVVLLTSVLLCYVGGLLMFWYHAEHLGEGGPAISWYTHWLLDSTVGFVALTPAVALIIPLASWVALSLAADLRRARWLFVALSGSAFALVTVPGPIAHNLLVGRGTWVANQVTRLVGNPAAKLTPGVKYARPELMAQQFRAGLPLYVLLMALAVIAIRGLLRAARRLDASAAAARPGADRTAPAAGSGRSRTDRDTGRLAGSA
jgi:hypothetical protein